MRCGALSIVAAELWPKVAATIKAEKVRMVGECDGAALVGLAYRHPFCGRSGRVVAAEYVTLEDGTGLVHTAPGHGAEDYRTGLKEGLPTYCPVRDDGTYDDTPARGPQDIARLQGVPVMPNQGTPLAVFSTVSSTFEIRVDVRLGALSRRYIGVLRRTSLRDMPVLTFRRE